MEIIAFFSLLCIFARYGTDSNLPGVVRPLHARPCRIGGRGPEPLRPGDHRHRQQLRQKGLLTVENRKRLIDDIYAGNPRVEARIYSGLTGEFAEQVAACAIIRGVRNTTDFEYERTMEATNHRIYPEITTVMLFTPAPVADISSSTVREVLSFGRTVEEFLPEGIEIEKYL